MPTGLIPLSNRPSRFGKKNKILAFLAVQNQKISVIRAIRAKKLNASATLPKRPIEELIEVVAGKLGLKPELICSGNRQRQYSEARSVLAWLAVEEVGHPAAEVARFLGISRVGVLLSLEKAKNICQKYEFQLTPPNPTDSIC